jgi:hypothetical protein
MDACEVIAALPHDFLEPADTGANQRGFSEGGLALWGFFVLSIPAGREATSSRFVQGRANAPEPRAAGPDPRRESARTAYQA